VRHRDLKTSEAEVKNLLVGSLTTSACLPISSAFCCFGPEERRRLQTEDIVAKQCSEGFLEFARNKRNQGENGSGRLARDSFLKTIQLLRRLDVEKIGDNCDAIRPPMLLRSQDFEDEHRHLKREACSEENRTLPNKEPGMELVRRGSQSQYYDGPLNSEARSTLE
jgi:hypothetical protein